LKKDLAQTGGGHINMDRKKDRRNPPDGGGMASKGSTNAIC